MGDQRSRGARQRSDSHRTNRLTLQLGHGGFSEFERRQGVTSVLEQHVSGIGEHHVAAAALDHRHSEFGLQRSELLGDGARCVAQRRCCCGDGAALRELVQCLDSPDVRNHVAML